jgi:hypothetical protein
MTQISVLGVDIAKQIFHVVGRLCQLMAYSHHHQARRGITASGPAPYAAVGKFVMVCQLSHRRRISCR